MTRLDHLKNQLEKGKDPLLGFEWMATVTPKNGDMPLGWYSIYSVQMPSVSFAKNEVFRVGTTLSFAGGRSTDVASVRLYAGIDGAAHAFAYSWLDAVFNTSGGYYNLPALYKRDIEVIIHDVMRNVVVQYVLCGCWPMSVQGANLDQSSEPMYVDLSLSVDSIRVKAAMMDATDGAATVAADAARRPNTPSISGINVQALLSNPFSALGKSFFAGG